MNICDLCTGWHQTCDCPIGKRHIAQIEALPDKALLAQAFQRLHHTLRNKNRDEFLESYAASRALRSGHGDS
jgi:hypothetical protein